MGNAIYYSNKMKTARKQILISQNCMPIGGAEKALIAMLENFDYSRFEVDLFLYNHNGELLKDIPSQVNMLPENKHYKSLSGTLIKALKSSWRAFLVRLLAKITCFLHSSGEDNYTIYDEIDWWGRFLLPRINPTQKYDVCISYLANHHIEKNKIKAKKYIAWIHTDYSSININRERNYAGWTLFDYIISISPSVHDGFARVYPSLKDKLVCIENCLSVKTIKEKAKEFDASSEMPGKIKLLSIGRYSAAKNFPGAVAIMAELCKLHDDVIWYVIGYGGEQKLIENAIETHEMQDKFILLGKRDNPYPYIAACDLYIQPSIYEGKCVAVQEAQILEKPVAITNYPMAAGQLENGVDGYIIPLEPRKAAAAIHKLLCNKEKMSALSHQCSLRNYSQETELTKLYALV